MSLIQNAVHPVAIRPLKSRIDAINYNINECLADLSKPMRKIDRWDPENPPAHQADFFNLEEAKKDRKYILAKIKQQRAALDLMASLLEEEYVHDAK